MSRWVQKNLKVYPTYPLAWDNNKTPDENQDIENKQPGAPTTVGILDWELPDYNLVDPAFVSLPPDTPLLGDDRYPGWYPADARSGRCDVSTRSHNP